MKGLVAQLIKVKDVSTATALEVAAGNRVTINNNIELNLELDYIYEIT